MDNDIDETDLNELLYEIYDTLKTHSLVESGNDFSRRFLGRSDRLYSYLLSSGNEPNLGMLLGLYARLDEGCWQAMRDKDHLNAAIFEELADELWEALRAESLQKGPHRRKKSVGEDAPAGEMTV